VKISQPRKEATECDLIAQGWQTPINHQCFARASARRDAARILLNRSAEKPFFAQP
jgi:hypothetical protein